MGKEDNSDKQVKVTTLNQDLTEACMVYRLRLRIWDGLATGPAMGPHVGLSRRSAQRVGGRHLRTIAFWLNFPVPFSLKPFLKA
jgi:hypothetical protein